MDNKMTIKEYIATTRESEDINIALIEDSMEHPLNIEIRFKPEKYDLSRIKWDEFYDDAEEASGLYAVITTTHDAFLRGVLEIKLSLIRFQEESRKAAGILGFIEKTLKDVKRPGY